VAILTITQANTRHTIALSDSSQIVQLTSNANAQTRVRFVNIVRPSDVAPKTITIDTSGVPIPSIRGQGYADNDTVLLTVDGETIDLMYDPQNYVWQIVNRFTPATVLESL